LAAAFTKTYGEASEKFNRANDVKIALGELPAVWLHYLLSLAPFSTHFKLQQIHFLGSAFSNEQLVFNRVCAYHYRSRLFRFAEYSLMLTIYKLIVMMSFSTGL